MAKRYVSLATLTAYLALAGLLWKLTDSSLFLVLLLFLPLWLLAVGLVRILQWLFPPR